MTIETTPPPRSKGNKDAKDSDTKKRKSSKKGGDVVVPIESSLRHRTRSNTNDSTKTIDDTERDGSAAKRTPSKKEVGSATSSTSKNTGKRARRSVQATQDDNEQTEASATPNESKKDSDERAVIVQNQCSEKKEKKSKSSTSKTSNEATTPVHLAPVQPSESRSKTKKSPLGKQRNDTSSVTTATPISTTEENTSPMIIEKPKPSLDVLVHRLRHFNYHPKPIVALASTFVFYQSNRSDVQDDSVTTSTTSPPNTSTSSSTGTAFHHKPPDSYIAISRESGCIELQTIHPKWRTIGVIAGRTNTPITLLTWIKCPKQGTPEDEPEPQNQLLSTDNDAHPILKQQHPSQRAILVGVNGADLYIIDFWDRQQLVSKYACPGGNIFSIQHLYDNVMAIGSQDGTIRILSVEVVPSSNTKTPYSYQFELISTIPTTGAAVVSLACLTNTESTLQKSGLVGTILFAGVADGTIRRYDCHPIHGYNHISTDNGSSKNVTASATAYFSSSSSAGVMWKSTLRMTVECYGRSTPTIVWTMKALSDGTVVSGDSLGHVQFWDGLTGTLISTFDQNDNKADVLALDVTSDETKIFTSGVDSRVVCIERQKLGGAENSGSSQWIVTHAQRPHTHDVKAMTIMKKFKLNHSGKITKQTEILFTGGIDTKLCTYHVSEFGLRRPRSLYPWPSLRSPIVAANKAKILTMLRENHVDLYELAKAPSSPKQVHAPVVAPDEETLIGTIQVKKSSNLSCCAISMNGTFLALCDSYAVFLFQIQIEATNNRRRAVPTTIPVVLPKGSLSIVAVQFIQESHLVLVTSQNTIHLYSLVRNDGGFRCTLIQTIPQSNTVANQQAWLLPIHSILCSADGLWMAATRNSYDQSDGIVDIYRSVNDGYQFWWSLPTLNTAVTAMSFLELQVTPMIAVACVDFTWYIFDLSKRCLGDWSVQAGYPLSSNKIPNDLAARNDYPIRICTNPANPSTLLIGSFGAIVVVNTLEAFPKSCRIFPEIHVRGTKRKRSNSYSESYNSALELSPRCTICLNYNSMLFMNFVDNHEMVVVEQPWLNVVATFPGALQRKVYGT